MYQIMVFEIWGQIGFSSCFLFFENQFVFRPGHMVDTQGHWSKVVKILNKSHFSPISLLTSHYYKRYKWWQRSNNRHNRCDQDEEKTIKKTIHTQMSFDVKLIMCQLIIN